MADIFLSYARADQPKIGQLAAKLEAAGHTLWWDNHIEGGQHFAKDIEREITAAKAVIVAWSAHSIESNWVLDEASYARDEKKLVPLSLDGTQPPFGYRQIQSLDFTGWPEDESAFARLQSALAKIDGTAPPTPDALAAPTSTPRAWAKPLIALIALLVIAGGAWWFTSGDDAADAAAEAQLQRSVAVLPFEDLSPDASDSWFAAGLAEEIAFALGRTPDLKVAATSATRALVDADVATNDMAEELAVEHFLQGSVRRAGDNFRISVTLFDTDGTQIWSERYDRPTGDAIQVQEEIATTVARTLGTALDPEALAAMVEAGTDSIAAYEAYLRVNAIPAISNRFDEIFGLLDQANAADPDYAAPYLARVDMYAGRFLLGTYASSDASSVEEEWRAFQQAAAKAREAATREVDRRWLAATLAEIEFRMRDTMEDLGWLYENYPNDTGLAFEYAHMKLRMANVEDFQADMSDLNKRSSNNDWMLQLSWLARDEQGGATLARQLSAEDSLLGTAYQAQRLLLRAGYVDEGRALLERIKSSGAPKTLWEMSAMRQACAEGRRDDALTIFNNRDDRSVGGDYQTLQILGMHDEARALIAPYDTDKPPYALAYIAGTPYFDPDHAPNMRALMQREGIPIRKPFLGIYCPPQGAQ